MELDIIHDKDNKRFYANISGESCDLKYKTINANILDYYSTFVPHSLRHQGIAGKITAFALAYARSHQCYVIPSCPFVKDYINEHPEWASLVYMKN